MEEFSTYNSKYFFYIARRYNWMSPHFRRSSCARERVL
jgi:hypothetical protein